jgi:hypothetical protein
MSEIPETAKIKGKIIEETLKAHIKEKLEENKSSPDEPPKTEPVKDDSP